MKIVPNRLLILLALAFSLTDCLAAPNDPPPPTPPPPPGLPVDGGLIFLVIASLCYGLYKVYNFHISKKNLQ
ncbi:MAG: hypothetical protein EOO51_06165 [Flavobacterium sp.]|nr:MAG: hypothetical protein EOO51_06165 [Flavobacterium sp.]